MLSRIFLRFLLLCGITALVVAALAAYVELMQPRPDPGAPLAVTVDKGILWPWEWDQGTALAVSFTPPPEIHAEPNAVGRSARLSLPWSAPLVEPKPADVAGRESCEQLPMGNRADETYALAPLFARERPYCWHTGVLPRLGGVLRVLHEPARLDYIDLQGQRQTRHTETASPLVLAIPWWLLFPVLLYLLLEWLAQQFRPKTKFQPSQLPEFRPASLPLMKLARRRIDPKLQAEWIPTLLIGLGGGGRQVLTQVAQALRDACYEPGTEPLLVALDVARDEGGGALPERVPGCLEALPGKAVFFLPESSCRLQKQINPPADPASPAAILDLAPYKDWPTDRLSLHQGTRGEGPLARLALLNDLAGGERSELLDRLRTALGDWRRLAGSSPRRQVIMVGNTEGGITRGWLTDLLILLRRLTAEDEQVGVAVDVSVLLLGQPEAHGTTCHPLAADRSALFDELDRLACAGRLPFRHGWADGSGILAETWVERRPQDALFVMSARREDWLRQLYPNAADALLLLADAQRRRDLTRVLEALRAEEERRRIRLGRESYTEIELRGAGFPHSFQHRLIELHLLELLLGDRVLFPGLDAEGKDLPPGTTSTLLEPPEPAATEAEMALFSLAAGIGGVASVDPAVLPGLIQVLWPRLQIEWTDHLHAGRWNLATLARSARLMAGNLRRGGKNLEPAALALEALADSAVEWIARLLGKPVAQRVADLAGCSNPAPEVPGLLPETRRDYQSVRERYVEWCANPTRVSVLPWENGDDALVLNWLRIWLGAVPDPDLEVRRRCRFELTVPGPSGQDIGLRLAFTGTQSERFDSAGLPGFLEQVQHEVAESLWPDMRQRFLEALGKTLGDDPETAVAAFATRLKGELRGDQATLLVSMPSREVAAGDAADRLRQALREALTQSAGAAEILRFHEARDPFRFLLWRLQPLRETQAQTDNPRSPIHPCERLRADYGQILARALGRVNLRLPAAAGLALADYDRLTAFAGLWLAGQVRREATTALWRLYDPAGKAWILSHFPEEDLGEAAARFVASGIDLPPPAAVPDRRPNPDADAFENLLCWVWQQRRPGMP